MEENRNPAEEQEKSAVTTATVCDIQFRSGSKIYYFDPNGLTLKAGDHVVIDTSRGPEFGTCTAGKHTVTMREVVLPLRKVLRLATAEDERINEENKQKETYAYGVCLKKIEELGLDMQLVSAEYAFDGSKILFFFTADGRVDFRELVKVLAGTFHTRIELRQIGMRDKAKMVGGFGICGRPFCCGQFLEDFQPVSIKMAKTQNLSLNPAKISGTCGRLMCCLKYEQEAYEDLIKTSPKAESFVDTVDGRGTVVDTNLMAQTVRVRMEKDPEEIRSYKNCDVCVLRNGKAKKTDPPIPEDLAPLSGKNAVREETYPRFERRRTVAALEAEMADESVPVTTTEETAPAEPQSSEGGNRRNRRNRRGRGGKPAAPHPENQDAAKKPEKKLQLPKKKEAPKQPKAAEAPKPPKNVETAKPQAENGGKKNGRRNYYRRHRKSGGKQEG